jgi:hypothetical protein
MGVSFLRLIPMGVTVHRLLSIYLMMMKKKKSHCSVRTTNIQR